jgi:hypothetical protein
VVSEFSAPSESLLITLCFPKRARISVEVADVALVRRRGLCLSPHSTHLFQPCAAYGKGVNNYCKPGRALQKRLFAAL